jgi:elongation factor Ts
VANVTIQSIKELRERTQAGMADCKSALQEADGDMDKAVEIILKRGQAKSAKRAGKVAAEGEVRAEVFGGGRSAAIVEVNIETDFSARNDRFKSVVDKAMRAAQDGPAGSDLSKLVFEGKTLEEHASEVTAIIGEKITLRRWDRLSIGEGKQAIGDGKQGFCSAYVHMGGKIGVILALEAETADCAKHEAAQTFAEETCMQIAAMNPLAVRRDDIPEDAVAKQREIFEAQMREEANPKPEKVWPKIIEGKLAKWYSEVALLDQESAQHKQKIDELRKQASKAAGAPLAITRFVRYDLGEGIEKKSDDLKAGVAELLK